MRLIAAVCCVSISILSAGCKGNSQVCVPGKSEACVGPGGCSGSQQCNAQGTAYEACDCGSVQTGADSGTPDAGDQSCNLATQAGCGAGFRCGWVQLTDTVGAPRCVPPGDVALHGACSYGSPGPQTGFDNCGAGLICATGSCMALCDLSSGVDCAQNFACTNYAFTDGSGTDSIGACSPTCDPLTQQRLYDGAAACASPDPANPTFGCYGIPDGAFTCAPVVDPTRKHRSPAGQPAYINGCAPGYLPLLVASSSDQTVMCIALCRPAETYAGASTQRQGVSPYSCPELGATGTGEECRYWWWLETSQANTAYSNTLGFCFDPSLYYYDHDYDSATPSVPMPSCADLPNTIGSAGVPQHLEWGCGPRP